MVRKSRPYSRSVFLLVLAGSVIPVLLFSMATTAVSSRLVDSIVETNVSDSLDLTGIRLEGFTGRTGRRLVAIAANLDVLGSLKPGAVPAEKGKQAFDGLRQNLFPPDEPPVILYLVSADGRTVFSGMSIPDPGGRAKEPTLALISEISKRPAGITISARHDAWENDAYISFSMATAVIGPSGKPEGYVIADIPRETLRTTLAPIPKIPEMLLLDGNGYIAWSLADPESEGKLYEAPPGAADPLMVAHRSGRLRLLAWKPSVLVTGLVETITLITLLCLALSLLLAFSVALLVSARISRPVMKIVEATKAVAEGDLTVRLHGDETGDIAVLMQNFNAMVADLKSLFDRTVEEQELLKQAELDSLGSQINPHFFFNALSSISALAKLGACAEINTVTIALGKLLRTSLASASGQSTVAASLVETRNYLTIEKIRFADRFSWTEDVGENLSDCEVPRLGIQVLVENALIHGIEPNPEPSLLGIRVREDRGILLIEVEDNGVGMGTERLDRLNGILDEGNKPGDEKHIGLANTNRRIKLVYGREFGICLRARAGGGIISAMKIPVRRSAPCIE